MTVVGDLTDLFRKKPRPTETLGTGGTAVFGGYVDDGEKNAKLVGQKRYETYSNLLANTSIVAASVRYFLNLLAKAEWKVEPADESAKAQEIAEWFDDQLHHLTTPWHRVVRRAGLYRYYGYSIQEWTAKRNKDGSIGILDVEARPQHTIEQWAVDESGTVTGVVQRSPQTMASIPIPRSKVVYLVDDSISDSPEGLGLFRHVVEAVERLREYERLEGIGFETDLRGIPVGRAPIQALNAAVKSGQLSQSQVDVQLLAMRTFLSSHKKTASLAMLLDSKVYESTGDQRNPSGQKQWDIDVIKSGQTSAPELAAAIQRLNREVARVLGTENILLGESGAGSLAMAEDKSDQFALVIDSSLKEIAESIQSDLIVPFMKLNGWDEKLAPTLKPDKIQHNSIQEITAALRDLATAGAVLAPDDPAINELRDMLGLSQVDLEQAAQDAALTREAELKALQAKAAGMVGSKGLPGSKPAAAGAVPAAEPAKEPTEKADESRWPKNTPEGKGGQFRPMNASASAAPHSALDAFDKLPRVTPTGRPDPGGSSIKAPFRALDSKLETELAKRVTQDQIKRDGKRDSVLIRQLSTFQPYADAEKVRGLIRTGFVQYDPKSPIIILKSGKNMYLWDGNHRAVAAHYLGQDRIEALVVDIGA